MPVSLFCPSVKFYSFLYVDLALKGLFVGIRNGVLFSHDTDGICFASL